MVSPSVYNQLLRHRFAYTVSRNFDEGNFFFLVPKKDCLHLGFKKLTVKLIIHFTIFVKIGRFL